MSSLSNKWIIAILLIIYHNSAGIQKIGQVVIAADPFPKTQISVLWIPNGAGRGQYYRICRSCISYTFEKRVVMRQKMLQFFVPTQSPVCIQITEQMNNVLLIQAIIPGIGSDEDPNDRNK